MNSKSMLMDGLADAFGFVGGALMGFWLGRLLGLDIFDTGYSNTNIFGIVLVGMGGGAGIQMARLLRKRNATKNGMRKEDSSADKE